MTQAYTNRFVEVHELFGAVVDTYAPGVTTFLPYRSLAHHQRGIAIVVIGDMAAGSTVDYALWQATDAAGANAKLVPGKAITQLTQVGDDEGAVCVIELRTEELDVDNRFSFLGGVLTIGGGNVDLALLGFAGGSNQPPVPLTAWTEIVD